MVMYVSMMWLMVMVMEVVAVVVMVVVVQNVNELIVTANVYT